MSKTIALNAVIDFGLLAVGDPACDLTILWTFFEGKSREFFHDALACDDTLWARGRAWVLWKALITLAHLTQTNAVESTQSTRVITEVLED